VEQSTERFPWWPYAMGVGLIHLAGLLLLLIGVARAPVLLGMGFLAYTLGLRHAFDADHIAAIDNTVRKLVQQGENPTGVGFFFSLGHSTVVTLMAVATGFAAQWAQRELPILKSVGGTIGTLVSGTFLLLIGFVNFLILREVWRLFWAFRRGEYRPETLEAVLMGRGFVARFAGPLWRFIGKGWHVFPLGFLFGLGFDTATEVALLALSAGAATQALPWPGILALPVLFAAGMTLMDTADGVFMTRAYGWAFSTPVRKLYYNLTVTGLSVVAALVIGGVELLQVVAEKWGLRGGLWDWIRGLELAGIGYLLVGLFVLTWGVSYGIWRLGRVEERWERSAPRA
jgi:high-affinity nickel-transport protein